ncbi:hypothetical protein BaRGS_00012407, partial [Batillaria attramentaria]
PRLIDSDTFSCGQSHYDSELGSLVKRRACEKNGKVRCCRCPAATLFTPDDGEHFVPQPP